MKFKFADRIVRFDPSKYGWPWSPGTASWVIPTAFSIVALKQNAVCNPDELSMRRIHLGVRMIRDRACLGGGWNSGNSVVYGVPLRPHIEATAIALVALQDEPHDKVVEDGLAWLEQQVTPIRSVSSLAWSILALSRFQRPVEKLKCRLASIAADGSEIGNNATLATALLALNCGERTDPFLVTK